MIYDQKLQCLFEKICVTTCGSKDKLNIYIYIWHLNVNRGMQINLPNCFCFLSAIPVVKLKMPD